MPPGAHSNPGPRGGPQMNSVGIDLHRKRSHIAALDESGAQLLSRRIVNDPQTFLALLEDVGDCRVALEATYGWEWLADVLQDAGYELHLAHPMRTKAIASARVKTDAVDARTLAQLLRADLLPEAYVAARELRDLRDLLRQRVVLTQMGTQEPRARPDRPARDRAHPRRPVRRRRPLVPRRARAAARPARAASDAAAIDRRLRSRDRRA